MPDVQLRIVEEGLRSSLYVSASGDLYRWYNDTDRWEGPLPTLMDATGARRYGGNRRVAHLVEEAFNPLYRGTHGVKKKRCPGHLQNAFRQLLRHPATIHDFASHCGSITESTAWTYACGVVERWPLMHSTARSLTHPPLLEALSEVDATGTLRDVLQRLDDGPLRYDAEWRHMGPERFSHLRLARLCVDAAEAEAAQRAQRNQSSSPAS